MIKKELPPNWNEIVQALGDVSKYRPIFAVAPHIYNPFDREMTADIIAHEEVHLRQQEKYAFPEMWCTQYLADKSFRLEAEVEAYAVQYAFGKEKVGKVKLTDAFLDSLASELCGEAYGSLLTFGEARSKIRNYAK